MFNGARILVAPLDWGLGHAARCVPIVRALLDHDAVPVIGADGGPLGLLKAEFPELEHVRLPGATVRYSRGKSQVWAMARQWPGLLRSIKHEHATLETIIDSKRIAAVISDQRFGLHNAQVPSVLVSHQIFPRTPALQGPLRNWNFRRLARFNRVWIPDQATAPGLAGDLSHGRRLPDNAHYIGPLSRMVPVPAGAAERFTCVAVLSGPEPQRTLLEQVLIGKLKTVPGKHLLVRGVDTDGEADEGNLAIRDRASDTGWLNAVLCGAVLIMARSGYSTIMDLHAIGRSALLIPTPGQPEQEYLATMRSGNGRFLIQEQDAIDLDTATHHEFAPPASSNEGPTTNDHALEHALQDLATLIHR